MAKWAASTNAQARYLLPFLVLPLPFFLPLLNFWLPTQRQYEAKFPTVENLAHVAGLQHDGECENLTDSGHGFKKSEA